MKTKQSEMNKYQILTVIPLNRSMPCATPLNLELAQHFCNHIEASTKYFFHTSRIRLSTLTKENTAELYTLTEDENSILLSNYPIVIFTDHKPFIFLFTLQSNPSQKLNGF